MFVPKGNFERSLFVGTYFMSMNESELTGRKMWANQMTFVSRDKSEKKVVYFFFAA